MERAGKRKNKPINYSLYDKLSSMEKKTDIDKYNIVNLISRTKNNSQILEEVYALIYHHSVSKGIQIKEEKFLGNIGIDINNLDDDLLNILNNFVIYFTQNKQ